jgi:hypothetical protein
MSLFENEEYRWRETYFVLFDGDNQPDVETLVATLKSLGDRFSIGDTKVGESGQFEALTLYSPSDFSAMDITFTQGDDVYSHIEEIREELAGVRLDDEELEKLELLSECDSRFDIFHFEKLTGMSETGEEDEMLDPGGVLIVLERLAKFCKGVAVDPQTGSIL